MKIFVEIELEGKNDVVGGEGSAVGEFKSTAQMKRVLSAVGGNAPGFCEGGFGALSLAVDVDEVGMHGADDFAGGGVDGKDGIESLRLGGQRDDEVATGCAGVGLHDFKVLRGCCDSR